ncbi:MAG: hypothetical protein ACM3SV_03620 [Betaproteobacteria bacterium]
MTPLTHYHNENGNIDRVRLFSAPDDEYFALVADETRLRYWQPGDPVPALPIPDGMTALTLTSRGGALDVYIVDSRAKFGPGVDPSILLQVDPRDWSQQFRTQAYCSHCGILKPSKLVTCLPASAGANNVPSDAQ